MRQAHRTLTILHRGKPAFVGVAKRHAIFEYDARDADTVEPLGDLGSFQVVGQNLMAAAWANHDCGAGVDVFGRTIDRQLRR